MKILLLLLLFPLIAHAQFYNTMQSRSTNNWKEINSDHFKIIYPDNLEVKAKYTLNLLEHYRPKVGKSYNHLPRKLTLIIRNQVGSPNGFVTYAPRRTEWFNNASISPLVGTLEWFQTLAIHEYRHVVQLDYLSLGNTRFGYYIFGEGFLVVLDNIVMPSWFFEGDAVWAETVLSDAGRGRMPRFSARLKAIITSSQEFSYDDFIAGDFTTQLPNLYVYGYFLMARMFKEYGKNVIKEISAHASNSPWNLYAFYSAFTYVTGDNFDRFFQETIADLKAKWGRPPKEFQLLHTKIYSESTFPYVNTDADVFYLYKNLDSFWGLYKEKKLLKEFAISPSMSQVDFTQNLFLYSQRLPHPRYALNGYSDIFIYNMQKDKLKQITKDQRYYHPKFSPNNKMIAAIDFDKNDRYHLTVMSVGGKIIKKITPSKNEVIAEAAWASNKSLMLIKLNSSGKKQLAQVSLTTGVIKNLTSPTRNMLYNLRYYKNKLYFEADYKGSTQIFEYALATKNIKKCTDEFIGAFTPHLFEDVLHYSNESRNGKTLKSIELSECHSIEGNLFSITDYLGQGPSDFYHGSKPVIIKDFDKFYISNATQTDHNEFTGSLSPHSWNFFGSRGWQLQGTSNTMINTLGVSANLGTSAEEGTPFAGLQLNYAKYFPIISVGIDYVKRKQKIIPSRTSSWTQMSKDIKIAFPYEFQNNLYSGRHIFSFGVGQISATKNDYTVITKLNDNEITTKSFTFTTSYMKQMTKRQIIPSLGYALSTSYIDLSNKNNLASNYFSKLKLSFLAPSFFKNHGWRFDFSKQYRPNNEELYQLQSAYSPTIGYSFSRGYVYEFTSDFNKATIQYVLPIGYPKFGLGDWIYFTRIYAKVWMDHTTVLNASNNYHSLNSKGIDLIIDSNTFRKFPFSYGIRLFNRDRDDQKHAEFFLGTTL